MKETNETTKVTPTTAISAEVGSPRLSRRPQEDGPTPSREKAKSRRPAVPADPSMQPKEDMIAVKDSTRENH